MLRALLIAIALGNSPFVVPPPPGSSSIGYTATGAGVCSGDDTSLNDNNGDIGCPRTGTTDPDGRMYRPQPCAAADASCTAGNLVLARGQDTTTIAIDGADPSVTCAGDNDTVTVTVTDKTGAVTATTLTEGTEWTAAASVATTCASLAAAVEALAGVTASCTSPDVLITLDATTAGVALAESTAGCTTVATGTAGFVIAHGGLSVGIAERITLDRAGAGVGDANDFLSATANGNVRITSGNDPMADFIGSTRIDLNRRVQHTGIFHQDTMPTVTLAGAATTYAATRNINKIDCDGGGNSIATITGDQIGMEHCLWFTDATCTIVDDDAATATDAIDLTGATTNLATPAAGSILCLVHDGNHWVETSRSVK